VGILEWLAAHLPGPILNVVRAVYGKPRPVVQVVELVPTGGEVRFVDFRLVVENQGNQQTRATVAARVGETPVQCQPADVNLLYNAEPTHVRILVPRPRLGELVAEFNHVTTLYGRTLTVEVVAGKKRLVETWAEPIYGPEDNSERHRIQQSYWRRGLGEETMRERFSREVREAHDREQEKGSDPDRSSWMG
jgi:hypothetical protein